MLRALVVLACPKTNFAPKKNGQMFKCKFVLSLTRESSVLLGAQGVTTKA